LYVERETFVDTLLATRTNWIHLHQAEAETRANATSLSENTEQPSHNQAERLASIWKQLRESYPAQAAWINRDKGQQVTWFDEPMEVDAIEALVRKPVSDLGTLGKSLEEQIGQLRDDRVPGEDPRWLNLYVRACRYRDCATALPLVRIVELRKLLTSECEKLLTLPTDVPRWEPLSAAIRQVAEALPPGRDLHHMQWEASIRMLEEAQPKALRSSGALLTELERRRLRWSATMRAVDEGHEDALNRLPEVAQDVLAFSGKILRSLQPMRDFLAVPAHASLETEWERHFVALQHDLDNREHFARVQSQAYRQEALVLETDQDPIDVVLRRTLSLLAELSGSGEQPRLAEAGRELAGLRTMASAIPLDHTEARYVLFAEICRVRRRIALANPLLDFNEILFIKRHLAIPHCHEYFYGNHCCDQYYGITQSPGGGLYVLTDPFGPQPRVRNVLEDSRVRNGRLLGQKLEGGSFLSPELSYDGRTAAFAYVECQGNPEHFHHTEHHRGHWDPGRAYHVFTVNLDGSNLRMLTDGAFNDFDPCFMPSGRIAFISERRGGYLRCGRICPTYTLFDMAVDGTDIRCLSFHETNEWHPSVTHAGMIIWTRWDYIDRHGCTAHQPWVTTPDGCDPRPIHGNYSFRRQRADMELDVRAIPGSHRFVATGAPHHGQAFGSLVVVDPRVTDDDAMAPTRRLTPRVAFPENETDADIAAYGEAWPLGENFFLCVYSPKETPRLRPAPPHGIYLLDGFGNQELIYADPDIGAHNPIPLRPRPKPPVVPERSQRLAHDQPAEATVGVVDVYNTAVPWPEHTKITDLRIYQVAPLPIASAAIRHTTGLQIPQGNDSVNVVRSILGTVPVEPDGSAHFVVPARKELFFQALDEDGLAVTSMRSGTHFQPGEHRVCAGCHEPKQQATTAPGNALPLAFRRAPSPIVPGPDGSNPFSYPRLVQPVLERNCVACHAEAPDKAPRLDAEIVRFPGKGGMAPDTDFYASYVSLAPDYGFYDYGGKDFGDPKWYRTTPGDFGARASRLYALLSAGHHDVELTDADLERIVLWLDSCSMFYGVYEVEGGREQLAGKVVWPTLE
jgi:hypothetical protein